MKQLIAILEADIQQTAQVDDYSWGEYSEDGEYLGDPTDES